MARTFSTGNYLTRVSPGFTSLGSISLWIKPTWSSGDGVGYAFLLYSTTGTVIPAFDFEKNAANNVKVGFITAGGTDLRFEVIDTGLFAAGVWAHHCITWSDTGFVAYWVNGTQIGFRGPIAWTTPAFDVLDLGANASGADTASADVAEYARWNRVLTDPQIADLAAGRRPVSPTGGLSTGLQRYVPILGVASPEPELIIGADFTLVGTPAQATHPTLIYDAIEIDADFIPSTAAVFEPSIAEIITGQIAADFIPSTSQVFAPSIQQPIFADFIPPTAQVFAPSIRRPISADFIASMAQVFEPSISQPAQAGLRFRAGVRLAEG